MSDQLITIILAVISSGLLSGGLTAWISRRERQAQAESTMVGTARGLIDELQEQLKETKADRQTIRNEFIEHRKECAEYRRQTDVQIKELEAELKVQETAIENQGAQLLKYQFALIILSAQLRAAGYEPVIDLSKVDSMNTEDLRLIADATVNIERRRQERKRGD